MKLLRKYIKVFILLFLPLYSLLLANSIMNMHVHVLSNGMVVRHAHPFHQQNEKHPHNHSGSEYSYYQGFFLDYCDTAHHLPKMDALTYVVELINDQVSGNYACEPSFFLLLRGPPSL